MTLQPNTTYLVWAFIEGSSLGNNGVATRTDLSHTAALWLDLPEGDTIVTPDDVFLSLTGPLPALVPESSTWAVLAGSVAFATAWAARRQR